MSFHSLAHSELMFLSRIFPSSSSSSWMKIRSHTHTRAHAISSESWCALDDGFSCYQIAFLPLEFIWASDCTACLLDIGYDDEGRLWATRHVLIFGGWCWFFTLLICRTSDKGAIVITRKLNTDWTPPQILDDGGGGGLECALSYSCWGREASAK